MNTNIGANNWRLHFVKFVFLIVKKHFYTRSDIVITKFFKQEVNERVLLLTLSLIFMYHQYIKFFLREMSF